MALVEYNLTTFMKVKTLILLVILIMLPILVDAQCSMCRAVLQNEDSQNAAKGINDGILYLMVFPYILVGGIGYYIYRMRKNKK